ncbi:MAG TPA: type II toxin-antitoxin system HicB family antitoxin [Candidatus Acidoferrales bacterium]|nr:type II toxin-antitoxin system HicB family antitoxin [Candidatus Acidoferrales bacterium]
MGQKPAVIASASPGFRPYHTRIVFHVTLTKAEDGWIVAECPALPGCASQGKDEREALANIREAKSAATWY